MSGKYDVESFVDNVIDTIKTNLTTKVAEINAEKNDIYNLEVVDNAHYYEDISQQVLNANPFIYYTPVELETTTVGANTSISITLAVSIVFDNTNDSGTMKKVLRYSRVLREIVQNNHALSPSASSLKVTEFVPTDITINDGSDFKMGGIHVTSTIVG